MSEIVSNVYENHWQEQTRTFGVVAMWLIDVHGSRASGAFLREPIEVVSWKDEELKAEYVVSRYLLPEKLPQAMRHDVTFRAIQYYLDGEWSAAEMVVSPVTGDLQYHVLKENELQRQEFRNRARQAVKLPDNSYAMPNEGNTVSLEHQLELTIRSLERGVTLLQ